MDNAGALLEKCIRLAGFSPLDSEEREIINRLSRRWRENHLTVVVGSLAHLDEVILVDFRVGEEDILLLLNQVIGLYVHDAFWSLHDGVFTGNDHLLLRLLTELNALVFFFFQEVLSHFVWFFVVVATFGGVGFARYILLIYVNLVDLLLRITAIHHPTAETHAHE